MANLVVTDSTHHKVKVYGAERRVKLQDLSDFLVRAALDLELNDGIIDELMEVSNRESIALSDTLRFLMAEYRLKHGTD